MNTVILVPWRPDNGRRNALWEFTRSHLNRYGYPIVEGASPNGPFNRAAAVNNAAEKAGDWDSAVITDADTICPAEQLDDAVHLSTVTGRLVFAFTTVTEVDQDTTDQLLAGRPIRYEDFGVEQIRSHELGTQSSLCVVPRGLWNTVGGMDEKFVGWGGEDNAFTRACTIHGGEPLRVDGTVYHLWHPVPPRERGYRRNLQRWQQYARAETVTDLARLRA